MEEIRELREGGAAPIRNTGREATKKLVPWWKSSDT